MASVTALDIITDALTILNVVAIGESLSPSEAQIALRIMNDLIDEWSTRTPFSPFVSRERFAMITDKGAPEDPYTIGIGGDLDTQRPQTQNNIVQANLILTTTTPEVRVPLAIMSDQIYDGASVPGTGSVQPTALYYNPTYDNDLGSLFLYPVPTVNYNELELFLQKSVSEFANLTTSYYLPSGLRRALKFNVALEAQTSFSRVLAASAVRSAQSSLSAFRRANQGRLSDMGNDASGIGSGFGGIYNILSDTVQGGR